MTRRPIPALVTALGVLAFLLVKGVGLNAMWSNGLTLEYVSLTLIPLGGDVAFAVGVFLVLWLMVPVSEGSALSATIGAGILAAVVGGALLVVYDFLRLLMSGVLLPLGMVFGELAAILALAPLTVLAAILLREWSRSKVAARPAGPSAEEPAAAV